MSSKNQKKEEAGSQETSAQTPTGATASSSSETAVVAVNGNVIKEREAAMKVAVALKVRSDKYTDLKGAVHVCEGYVWDWLKKSYPDTEDRKAEFDKLIQSTGLGARMVARYIQLAQKLVALRKLNSKTQVLLDDAIEGGKEISVEIVEKVADKVGRGKTMTDLMREVGILPPLDTKSKGRDSSLKDKVSSAVKHAVAAVKQINDLADSVMKSGDPDLQAKFLDGVNNLIVELQGEIKKLDAEKTKVEKEMATIQATMTQQQAELEKATGEVKAAEATKVEPGAEQIAVGSEI